MAILSLAAGLALTTLACEDTPTGTSHDYRDGELLARPGPPTGTLLGTGEHTLDLGRERDPVVYIPAGYDTDTPAPLLVLFHGSESSARFWEPLYADADRLGVVFLMINSQRGIWDSFFRQGFSWDASTTDEALQQVFDRVAIDPDAVGFAGFSAGATYTVELGLRNPELVRHIMVWSGGFRTVEPAPPLARVFISHGDDDGELPVFNARRLAQTLTQHGYDVTYIEFQGGHYLTEEIVDAALAWYVQ